MALELPGKRGWFLIGFVVLAMLPVWAVLNVMTDRAPDWLRTFTATVRQQEPGRDPAYVCLGDFTPFSWDRMFVVPASGSVDANVAVTALAWRDDDLEKVRAIVSLADAPVVILSDQGVPVWFAYLPRFRKSRFMDDFAIRVADFPDQGLPRSRAVFAISAVNDEWGVAYVLSPAKYPEAVPCRERPANG